MMLQIHIYRPKSKGAGEEEHITRAVFSLSRSESHLSHSGNNMGSSEKQVCDIRVMGQGEKTKV